MREDAIIILDPVNNPVIDAALASGVRDYIGGNCTVSLMLMALDGLLKADLIEWATAMTYQAASGAGAKHMRELLVQMGRLSRRGTRTACRSGRADSRHRPHGKCNAARTGFPDRTFRCAAGRQPDPGSTRTWATAPAAKSGRAVPRPTRYLGRPAMGERGSLVVEGLCVRIGAMRCHSQALTIKLKRDLPLNEIESLLAGANRWVRVVPNRRDESIAGLSPALVNGTLHIPIGRLRKLAMGPEVSFGLHRGRSIALGSGRTLAPHAADPGRQARLMSWIDEYAVWQGLNSPRMPSLRLSKLARVSV